MKAVLLASLFLVLGANSAEAQEEPKMTFELPGLAHATLDQTERTIEVSELPIKIQTTLKQNQKYQGWIVKSAKAVENPKLPSATFYKIELTNGIDSKEIKLDGDGEVIAYY